MGRDIDRRIGQRFPSVIDAVEWRPPVPPRRRLFRTEPPLVQVVRIIDLSVTGAGILAPSEPPLANGTSVPIRVGDAECTVTICWQMPTSDPAYLRYGVSFVEMNAEFDHLVTETITSKRPAVIGYFWARAE